MKKLDIPINASTTQSKGKFERKFRFFQDRLIKELTLKGIKDYDEANRFLKEEFLPRCNRYTQSIYSSLGEDKNLAFIFCVKYPSRVNYNGRVYELLP